MLEEVLGPRHGDGPRQRAGALWMGQDAGIFRGRQRAEDRQRGPLPPSYKQTLNSRRHIPICHAPDRGSALLHPPHPAVRRAASADGRRLRYG